jgi:hypothetical protein
MENVYIPYNDVGEYYTKFNSHETGNEIPKFYAPSPSKPTHPKCMGVIEIKYLCSSLHVLYSIKSELLLNK